MRKLGCIILAAGRAERFGKNKLLEPLGGVSLLSRVLDMLPRERFSRILAVVSCEETQLLCRSHGVEALRYGGGFQSDSIRLGLQTMTDLEGCLFVMGDQPLCRRDSLLRMIDRFEEAPGPVYRLSFEGTQASPVLFPNALFPALLELRGERGGMWAARGYPVESVEAEDAAELWDADTPQALAQLEAHLSHINCQ